MPDQGPPPAPPGERRIDWTIGHANRRNWQAVLDACEAARRDIAIEQFILAPDGIGQTLLDLLAAKARSGVAVRVILDAFGSRETFDTSGARALAAAGGEIVSFQRTPKPLSKPLAMVQRLHRKTVVCDGARMVIGGSCFAPTMADWRDTMLDISGPPAAEAARAFDRLWHRCRGTTGAPAGPPPAPAPVWRYVVCGERRPREPHYARTLKARIDAAERSVILGTPYLVPDRGLWRILKRALRRGVRLCIVVPEKGDLAVPDFLTRHIGRAMARAGVEIHAYRPAMFHAKLALVDDAWASVGSLNLDLLSLNLNLEAGVTTTSPALCAALAEQFERDLAASVRI